MSNKPQSQRPMNMSRIAALLIILSQILLLIMLIDPNGSTAIMFAFAAHPLVGVGAILGLWAIIRREREVAESSST